MDAIIISKFIFLLTLLASVQAEDSARTLLRNSSISDSENQQKQFANAHSQLKPVSETFSKQHKTTQEIVDLPKPLKLLNNYDYDDSNNATSTATDEPRRLKHKPSGSLNSRLTTALNIAAKQGLDAMVKLYEKTEPEMLRRGR